MEGFSKTFGNFPVKPGSALAKRPMKFYGLFYEVLQEVHRTSMQLLLNFFLGIKNLDLGTVPFMSRQACNLPETLSHKILGSSA